MALQRLSAPSTWPVSLADVKAHCRVDLNDDDALLQTLLEAATELAEQATGRALMPQTWELSRESFPPTRSIYSEALVLTRVPVQSIVSLSYTDAAGVIQTLLPVNYLLNNCDDFGFATVAPAFATLWPSEARDVKLRFVAGCVDASLVPASIKQWIKLQVAAMYENREAETNGRGVQVKLGFVDALLNRYLVNGGGL
jgi:uncharacterized phiE125 gp8 family phage protein